MSRALTIAVVGNPNSGKSSLFNELTGLDQKVGNFPGVTVDLGVGKIHYEDGIDIQLIDLPGAYSLHGNTKDELVTTYTLLDNSKEEHPDGILYVADLKYLDKQLLLLSQLYDCRFPLIVALSNIDKVDEDYKASAVTLLKQKFKCPVFPINNKNGNGITALKSELRNILNQESHHNSIFQIPEDWKDQYDALSNKHDYLNLLWGHYGRAFDKLKTQKKWLNANRSLDFQVEETMSRYNILDVWLAGLKHDTNTVSKATKWTEILDKFATHSFLGLIIFFITLAIVFQAIFSWAAVPMDYIESLFSNAGIYLHTHFPPSPLLSLIADGILSGLSGVFVFVPQIAILFFLIGILEEIGYMARVVFMFDHILRWFGLNGRSIIGLVSGGACAVPAIMTTRTIANRKQRLITMFVIPFIPCSARIPVYTALIAFLVPSSMSWGIFNTQGLVFMALYMLGILMALFTAFGLKLYLKSEEKDFLLIQLPDYQIPNFKQILFSCWTKTKSFIFEAGKIIILISVILWFLSNFSFPGVMDKIEQDIRQQAASVDKSEQDINIEIASAKLEASFAGKIGKIIEPVIAPLGFDWKIGIAIITSFAAREVFVGTMATIYNLEQDQNQMLLREKMAMEKRENGLPFYDFKTALSLILFYAFALQCISTLAVMKRETQKWKWPVLQFVFMTGFAYLVCFIVYHLL